MWRLLFYRALPACIPLQLPPYENFKLLGAETQHAASSILPPPLLDAVTWSIVCLGRPRASDLGASTVANAVRRRLGRLFPPRPTGPDWRRKQAAAWWTDTITKCFLASANLSSVSLFFFFPRCINIAFDRGGNTPSGVPLSYLCRRWHSGHSSMSWVKETRTVSLHWWREKEPKGGGELQVRGGWSVLSSLVGRCKHWAPAAAESWWWPAAGKRINGSQFGQTVILAFEWNATSKLPGQPVKKKKNQYFCDY